MTDIFDRAAVKAIDKLVDLLHLDVKSRTVAYQYLGVVLRGAWYQEHQIAMDDDQRVFADQIIELRIRHKEAVPPQWAVLDIPVFQDDRIPLNEMRIVYHTQQVEIVNISN